MTTRNHPIEAEELMAYLDGELPPDQATVAANHLETCMECQQLAADLRGVSQTLNAWELQPTNSTMPEWLAAAGEEHIPELQPILSIPLPWFRRLRFREWAPLLAGCAVITLVAGSRFLIRPQHAPVFSQAKSAMQEDRYLADSAPAPPTASPSASSDAGVIRSIVPPPSAGKNHDRLQHFSKLQASPSVEFRLQRDTDVPAQVGQGSGSGQAKRSLDLMPTSPMIIRTAELSLTTREFDKGRAQVEDILKRHRGYIGSLNVTGAAGTGRTLTASLRIPSTQLDPALAELKSLGRLVSESKTGQEVTAQYVDLQARLNNSRNTEKRLIELLANRTGKLSDVLEVENELTRIRGEVESMEAERKNLSSQVDFATINLTLTEDYRAQLQVVPPSTSTRLINASIEGYRSMVDGLMSVALFFLSSGPTLLVWAAILFFPARFAWKRIRNLSGASL